MSWLTKKNSFRYDNDSCNRRDRLWSPPRDCVKCKMYKVETISNDKLMQWFNYNKRLHISRTVGQYGDAYNFSIYSPLSRNSPEGKQLEKCPSSSCCSDADDGSEKHTLQEDKRICKRRRNCYKLNDEVFSDDADSSVDGRVEIERNYRPGTRRIMKNMYNENRCNHRSALTNLEHHISKSEPEMSRSRNTELEKHDLPLNCNLIDTGDPNNWLRETFISLSEGTASSSDINYRLPNNISGRHEPNGEEALLATLAALSRANNNNDYNSLRLATLKKALHHSEKTLLSEASLIKETTLIKIEKNDLPLNSASATQPMIQDRVQIDRNNSSDCVQINENVTSTQENKDNLLCLTRDDECNITSIDSSSREGFTRPPTCRSSSPSYPSYDSSQFSNSKISPNLSSSPVPNDVLGLAEKVTLSKIPQKKKRQAINRKAPTAIMQLFSDHLKTENPSKSNSRGNSESLKGIKETENIKKGFCRSKTAEDNNNLQNKKTISQENSRPRSALNQSVNNPNIRTRQNRKPSSHNNTPTTPTSEQEDFKNLPPSRKPTHLSPKPSVIPSTSITPKKEIPTSKNNHTIGQGTALRGKKSLKATIEKNLKMDELLNNKLISAHSSTKQSEEGDYAEDKLSVPANIEERAADTNNIINSSTNSDKDIENGRGHSTIDIVDNNSANKCNVLKTNTQEVNTNRNITSAELNKAPIRNGNSGKRQTQRDRITPNKSITNKTNTGNQSGNYSKKDFSVPEAKKGHPLRNMTLAQYQSKRNNVNNCDQVTREKKPSKKMAVSIFEIWNNGKTKTSAESSSKVSGSDDGPPQPKQSPQSDAAKINVVKQPIKAANSETSASPVWK